MTKKLAVFMPSWVGDAAMATPTLRALANLSRTSRNANGEFSMIGIMQPIISELIAGTPWFDEQIVFRKSGVANRLRLVQQLRAAQIDTIVMLTNSWWTAAVARLAGIPRRVGYARDGRGWMLSDTLPIERQDGRPVAVPAIEYYLQLAGLIGADVHDRRMELSVSAADSRLADELWQRVGFEVHRPTIVINSSGAWGAAKLWPVEHVEKLALRIAENHQWQVLLHCGPAERAATDAIATRLNHPQVRSMGQCDALPMGLSKAVLARACAVVSTDSGPRHIAAALDRPVISLFGPTEVAWTKTYNQREAELGLNLACRGCWQKSCPLQHHRCMRDMGVEMVYGSLVQAIHQSSKAAFAA